MATVPALDAVITSNLARALDGRRINIAQELVDTVTSQLSVLYRRFGIALAWFLRDLKSYEEVLSHSFVDHPDIGAINLSYVTISYLNLIYATTELFDIYKRNELPTKFGFSPSVKKDFDKNIEATRREVSLICNRCKHNANVMLPVFVEYESGELVPGYTLYEVVRGSVGINLDIHRRSEAHSFRCSLSRLLISVVYADDLAAQSILAMDEVPTDALDVWPIVIPVVSQAMTYLAKHQPVPMPKEERPASWSLATNGNPRFTLPANDRTYGAGRMCAFLDVIVLAQDWRGPYNYALGIEAKPAGTVKKPTIQHRVVFPNLMVHDD